MRVSGHGHLTRLPAGLGAVGAGCAGGRGERRQRCAAAAVGEDAAVREGQSTPGNVAQGAPRFFAEIELSKQIRLEKTTR